MAARPCEQQAVRQKAVPPVDELAFPQGQVVPQQVSSP
jgi:hypothetical protein